MPSADVVIVLYADGPYLVRGPAIFRDQDGVAIDPERRTAALCCCGNYNLGPRTVGIGWSAPSAAVSQPS